MNSLGVALEKMGEPRPGGVKFASEGSVSFRVTRYEINSLLEKTFGRAAWLTHRRGPPLLRHLKTQFQRPRRYRTMWIYPDMTPDCYSFIRVEAHPTPWWQAKSWLRLLGLSDSPVAITANMTEVRCG
jgi:hypothetical protein